MSPTCSLPTTDYRLPTTDFGVTTQIKGNPTNMAAAAMYMDVVRPNASPKRPYAMAAMDLMAKFIDK